MHKRVIFSLAGIYSPSGELYDVGHDLGETKSLSKIEPGKNKTLSDELLDAQSAGRAADTRQPVGKNIQTN